jgi:phosphohistidine phosphatase
VIRHGHAGDPVADAARDDARALSARGKAQARRAGSALARLGLLPRAVWTSPLRRAAQTADAAAAAARTDAHRVVSDALLPEEPPGRLLAELAETVVPAGKAPLVLWLVGHEPHLSSFVALCAEDLPHDLRIRKGDVLVLEGRRKGVAADGFRVAHHLPAAELEGREE